MVVDGRADGIKQSKLSGRYIQGLQMPFSCALLSFRPQLECPDGSSGHLRQLQYFDILQSGIPFGKPRHRSTSRQQAKSPNFSLIQTGKLSKFT